MRSNGQNDSVHAEVALWDYFVVHNHELPKEIYNWRTIASGEERFNASPCSRCQEDSEHYGVKDCVVYLFDEVLGWQGKRMCDFETLPSSRNREWNTTCCVSQ